ncbi:uncharacterized protein LOC110270106 [Arachis ipaensis]|uniref:uncharacterized protein LOC110270106 n=1 Tax=Arachis ipaensis TaxID=130454 RepID=UPI000A2B5DB8|nr:uncharacterized protein LOC110270106 [Arachis ipaensis]XP_025644169.1 uncharacterized protein LOC112738095 [Arachis hypogaea]
MHLQICSLLSFFFNAAFSHSNFPYKLPMIANGTYYTSSTTRRTGSDGVIFEVAKEADSSIRKVSHRVSKGIHCKGHSLSRKLNSDGRVDMQAVICSEYIIDLIFFN